MKSAPDDELLSAYLDGELADDERARVERWLAEQPESRQLLEELRAVKQRLETLPAARLGEDFADRVLRQAEREMLSGGGAMLADATAQAREVSRADGSGFTKTLNPPSKIEDLKSIVVRHRRSVVWASLALAAGLLIMFVDRDRQRRDADKQVAMAPEREQLRAGAERWKRAEIGAARDARDAEISSLHEETAEGASLSPPAEVAPPLPAWGPESTSRRRMAAETQQSELKRLAETSRDEKTAGESLSHESKTADEAPVVDDETLLVWCELSPDAPAEENFSQLLAQQNISWQPAANPDDQRAEKFADESLDRGDRSKRAEYSFERGEAKDASTASVDPRELTDALKRRGLQREKDHTLPTLEALEQPGAQMILVEATDSQVQAVLKAMDQDQDTYRTVDVEPAPEAPRQQSLSQYSRAAPTAKKELAKGMGRMSVQNSVADLRLPQGRAMRLQMQAGGRATTNAKTGKPAAPSSPALASAASGTESREADEAAAQSKTEEATYRVLFVLVPPAEEAAKPAAGANPQP